MFGFTDLWRVFYSYVNGCETVDAVLAVEKPPETLDTEFVKLTSAFENDLKVRENNLQQFKNELKSILSAEKLAQNRLKETEKSIKDNEAIFEKIQDKRRTLKATQIEIQNELISLKNRKANFLKKQSTLMTKGISLWIQ